MRAGTGVSKTWLFVWLSVVVVRSRSPAFLQRHCLERVQELALRATQPGRAGRRRAEELAGRRGWDWRHSVGLKASQPPASARASSGAARRCDQAHRRAREGRSVHRRTRSEEREGHERGAEPSNSVAADRGAALLARRREIVRIPGRRGPAPRVPSRRRRRGVPRRAAAGSARQGGSPP